MKRAKKNTTATLNLVVGDYILLGGARASYPGDWYLGRVFWANGRNVVVERATQNGEIYDQMCGVLEVRAVGSIADLIQIQRQAREGVAQFSKVVHEAEYALSAARDALWAKLDELAKGGLAVIPPHHEEMEAQQAAEHEVLEQLDAELIAGVA